MSKNTSSILNKVWSFCNPLREVGVGCGDSLEQTHRFRQNRRDH